MLLSNRARKLLRDALGELADRASVEKASVEKASVEKKRGAVTNAIIEWCRDHDIELGARLTHDRLRLDAELLGMIDETLVGLGEPALGADLGGLSTTQQAVLGNREDKAMREKPRARRVLASLPAMGKRAGLIKREREVVDIDWRDIDLDAFEVLVQIENLDGFYDFSPAIPALEGWSSMLMLYRGDRHYGGGFSRLAEAWRARGKPHLYLGDFDAKGIGIALSSGATHLLLPPPATLAERANPQHLPPEQQGDQRRLRAHVAGLPMGHPLADSLAILLDDQRGLRQQWFGDAERWRRVALYDGLPSMS